MLSSTAAASRSAMHTKTWTDKEREILIDEVRQKPELYNNTHQEFKNKERRAQAFERIAEVISSMPESTPVDGRTVSSQWKILKDSFNRTRKTAANNKSVTAPVWRFYRQMEFLVPFTTRYDNFSPPTTASQNMLQNSSSTHYSDTGEIDEEDDVDDRSKTSTPRFVMSNGSSDKVVIDTGNDPSTSHSDDHIEVHTPNGSHEIHGPHFMSTTSSFHYRDRFSHDEDINLAVASSSQHVSNHILLSTIDNRKRPFPTADLCLPTTALISHGGSASASSTNSSTSVPFTTTGNLEDYVVDVVKRRVFDAREDDFDLYGRLVASSVRDVAHFDQKLWLEMRREIDDIVYKYSKKKYE